MILNWWNWHVNLQLEWYICRKIAHILLYFIKYNVHTSIGAHAPEFHNDFWQKKLILFFKNTFTRINHYKFIHHRSHLKPFLSCLPCIVRREYFSIIFHVKKCALYSIKYGMSFSGTCLVFYQVNYPKSLLLEILSQRDFYIIVLFLSVGYAAVKIKLGWELFDKTNVHKLWYLRAEYYVCLWGHSCEYQGRVFCQILCNQSWKLIWHIFKVMTELCLMSMLIKWWK